jgi:hypothetical protein
MPRRAPEATDTSVGIHRLPDAQRIDASVPSR